jgi:hypothetical protein
MGSVENEVWGMKRGRRFGPALGRFSRRKFARYPKMTMNLKRHNVPIASDCHGNNETPPLLVKVSSVPAHLLQLGVVFS